MSKVEVEKLFFGVVKKDEASKRAWQLFGDFITADYNGDIVASIVKAVNSELNINKNRIIN